MIEAGSHGSTFVQALQGDKQKWDQWAEIRRCNPLVEISDEFRAKLLEERDEARADSRLKARFLSYRLNVPTGDESTMLLTVDDWERICSRPTGPRDGLPIVGIDLGGGRAWSSAVAIFPSGRIEAIAYAPGKPSLEDQEKRDRVPAGTYRALHELGALRIAEGLHVQPPAQLWDAIVESWGSPELMIADRARFYELRDCIGVSAPLVPRTTRWFSAADDVRALRKLALDGPLSCDENSRALLGASLASAMVKNDDQGSTRLVKRGTNNEARDDVAAALLLASGEFKRRLDVPPAAFEFEHLEVSA